MSFFKRVWCFILQLSHFRLGILVFSTAFIVRLAIIVIFHPYHDMSRLELERTAISLATTGVFGNPYAVPTGPTAHVSPGYPLILAGLFRLFGTGVTAQIIKELLAAVVTSFLCALLPALARSIDLDPRSGIAAGFICALYPAKPLVELAGDWETPYTALFLMLICIATVRLWKEKHLSTRKAMAHGFLWGFALLFVGALLPMLGVFVVLGFYFCRAAGVSKCVKFTAIELLIAAACLTPWVIRNYYALGSPIVSRSNLGIEMRVSNNDFATPDERLNAERGVYRRYHPLLNPEEALKVRKMGEVAYNKELLNETRQWIRTHPKRFLQLCIGRARDFWFFPDPTSRIKTLFLDTTGLLGFVGLFYILRRSRLTGIVLLLVLLMYPVPNYLIHVGLRQRYPIDWLLTLLTTVTVFIWLDTVTGITASRRSFQTVSR